MWKKNKDILILAAIFLPISAVLYFVHYLIFHDTHHIFIYLIGDLAFVPIEVFLVVIVIERLLAQREKRELMQKLNMVIGAFFSEVGTYLMGYLLPAFDKHDEIAANLNIRQNWSVKDFKKAITYCRSLHGTADPAKVKLSDLKTFFVDKRPFLLALLENPNLLEDERFTDVLWAAFHLAEELEFRQSFDTLPAADIQHIGGDIWRLYGYLLLEWLEHTQHLKLKYPYLYSLVLRTHPFQKSRSAVVEG